MSCDSNSKTRHRINRAGLSLIELMVVLLIIGLLTSAITVGVQSFRAAGMETTAEMELNSIATAMEMFSADFDRYPTQEEGLEVLIKPNKRKPKGYLDKVKDFNDPWGNPYLYIRYEEGPDPFEVICIGLDGREGTEDDFSNLSPLK